MPTPELPRLLDDVAGYHGDTTPLTSTVRLTVDGDVAGATATMQLRDRHEALVLTLEPEVVSAADGTVEIAPVVLEPADWTSIPRTATELLYDMEIVTPALGTVTIVRGRLLITRDVTRPL